MIEMNSPQTKSAALFFRKPDKIVSVILADPYLDPVVYDSLEIAFANHGIHLISRVYDGAAAVKSIIGMRPDFAFLDCAPPGMTNVEVITKVRNSICSSTKLIVQSISPDRATVSEAMCAGANAYLIKDAEFREVLDAMSSTWHGGYYMSPPLSRMNIFAGPGQYAPESLLATLNLREMELCQHLVDGVSQKDIEYLMGFPSYTAFRTCKIRVMRKLGVKNLVGLVKFAVEQNITSAAQPEKRIERSQSAA